MHFSRAIVALALNFALASAFEDFSQYCNTPTIVAVSTLVASCKIDDGIYTTATLNLDECIEDNQGTLAWKKSGAFSMVFSYSTVIKNAAGAFLIAAIDLADASTPGISVINLDEQIENTNGVLSCPNVS